MSPVKVAVLVETLPADAGIWRALASEPAPAPTRTSGVEHLPGPPKSVIRKAKRSEVSDG